jgi:hypothetical protein
MKLNKGIIPPNGFHFPVDGGVTLKAATYELLIKEIETWRTQNGIAIGEPERDVDNYFCAKWPHFCLPEPHETTMLRGDSINKQVNAWAAIMLRNTPMGGYNLVNQDEAENRCKTCVACPFNKAWRGTCANCTKATDTILIRLRQLRKITLDESLLGCSINGFDNKTAIHLTTSGLKITPEKKSQIPQNCWIHNTQY